MIENKMYEKLISEISKISDEISKILLSIDKLENEHINGYFYVKGQLESHLERIKKLENLPNKSNTIKPHKCPICDAKGYTQTNIENEKSVVQLQFCTSCQGKGIVWG